MCTTNNGADFSQRAFDLIASLTFITPQPDAVAGTQDYFDLLIR